MDKALAIDPNYKEALNNKGNALSSQGNYTQAITYYDKALAIDPGTNMHYMIKQIHLIGKVIMQKL